MEIESFKQNLLTTTTAFRQADKLFFEIEPIKKKIIASEQYVPFLDPIDYSQPYFYNQECLDDLESNFLMSLLDLHINITCLLIKLQFEKVLDEYEKLFQSISHDISNVKCFRQSLYDPSFKCKNQYLSECNKFIKPIENFFIEEQLSVMYAHFVKKEYAETVKVYEEVFTIKDFQAYYKDHREIIGYDPNQKFPPEIYLKAKLKIVNPLYKFDKSNEYYTYINQLTASGIEKYVKGQPLSSDEDNIDKLAIYNGDALLSFGKHSGLKLNETIQKDPEYILWCLENLIHFSISYYALLQKPLLNQKNYFKALEYALIKNFVYKEWKLEEEKLKMEDERETKMFDYYNRCSEEMGRQETDRMTEETGGFWDDF